MSAAETSNIEQLLIVRLSAMGDVIHTLPAAQALRKAFPHAMIGWIIEERWSELLCAPETAKRGGRSAQRPLVDWVHTVDLKAWRKSMFTIRTIEYGLRAWNDLRSVQYDLAVDLQGAIRSAVLARLSRASIVWGASEPREAPASLWYTRQAAVRGKHVIEQNLSIAEAVVGQRLRAERVEFPYDPRAEKEIDVRLAELGSTRFVLISPGAGWGAKCWPAERYGQVAATLRQAGVLSLVNHGPGEEGLARAVEEASDGAAVRISCSISELIALTRRAQVFISGDTGPMHLAAALQVPVVAIFGPTDPARNGPYGTQSIVLRSSASTTSHARKQSPDEAMLEIGVDQVVSAARSLLTDGGVNG